MVRIRPVRSSDLEDMVELAQHARFGLTSLPKDRELLAKRIALSELSFSKPWDEPAGELYIFVMEDTGTGTVFGTSGIISKVGGFEPFWAYRIENVVHESKTLGIRKEIATLNLQAEHSGPTEIGGLFLHPEYRKHGSGRLLSLFRFLFMIEHRERFEPEIIAEMRGAVDENGRTPFWEAVGRHFFDIDFPEADYLSVKNKRFIADLMPRSPIYIPLLPNDARAVIGKVHPSTEPALKLLKNEGFEFRDLVDIFEAGPMLHCTLEHVRTARQRSEAILADTTEEEILPADKIVTSPRLDFRACAAGVREASEKGITLTKETADALELQPGDRVVYAPLKA